MGSNILTLMANRHPYSDAAAPRHVRARAVEIHEEEAAAQKIRRVMQRRKEGRGGEGPSDFEDTSRVQSERKTDAMCSEIKCIDMIWH